MILVAKEFLNEEIGQGNTDTNITSILKSAGETTGAWHLFKFMSQCERSTLSVLIFDIHNSK